MAFTAKMAFSPPKYCRLFAEKKVYQGGSRAPQDPPLATPLTTTFMGGAVVIPVIMQIHTDFLCPFQTPDRTLTRRNQMLRDDDIFSKVEQKKSNKQNGRLLSFLLTFDPDTWQTNTVIFSEFNWKIVFSKITSRISKPLSVFDKLGLGSKYRGWGEQHFSTQSGKTCNVTRDAQIKSLRRSPSSTRREKRGDCKLAWSSAVSTSRKLLLRLEETSEISGWL